MLDIRTIQRFVGTNADGVVGPKTIEAATNKLMKYNTRVLEWESKRILNGCSQVILKYQGFDVGIIDGIIGSQSLWALEQYQAVLRDQVAPDDEITHMKTVWPRQKDVPEFYGEVGEHQTRILLPYKMKLAWDPKTIISRMTLHEKVAPSAERAFKKILLEYGEKRISELGLDMFGGSLNVRKMRGGTKYSMHSWGIAIDFDPINNRLRWGADRAKLDHKDYIPFWEIWESEGWVSLGREKNYDWMHVQAARL